MIYLLSALFACLALIAWHRSSLRTARERGEALTALISSEHAKHKKRAETDARLLADAWALLHDSAARGKDGRWIPWSERRKEWDIQVMERKTKTQEEVRA